MDNKAQLLTNKNLSFSKMLPRDTKKINEIRQKYGFYLNSLISEFERIRELNAKRHQKYINKFSKNLIESLNDFQVYLSDRIAYYDDIKEEGNNNEEQVEENKQQQNNNQGEIRGGNDTVIVRNKLCVNSVFLTDVYNIFKEVVIFQRKCDDYLVKGIGLDHGIQFRELADDLILIILCSDRHLVIQYSVYPVAPLRIANHP